MDAYKREMVVYEFLGFGKCKVYGKIFSKIKQDK